MISYPATRIWEAELRAGLDGQDRMLSSTWRLDALHRAVCCEANAREAFAQGNDAAGFGWLDASRQHLADEVMGRAA